MAKCSKCGKSVSLGAGFCSACGKKIEKTETSSKMIPKWYLMGSMIISIIMVIFTILSSSSIGYFLFSTGPLFLWSILSLVLGIYLLAKRYPKFTLIIPSLIIFESILLLISIISILIYIRNTYYIEFLTQIVGFGHLTYLVFMFLICGTSLYLLWRKPAKE